MKKYSALFSLLILLFSSALMAQETETNAVMDMPVSSAATDTDSPLFEGNVTHPLLRLSQDKSEMIALPAEAASVVVGNPNHINVLLDTPRTLILVPRAAGASHFSVIGKDGSTLMARHVVVGGPKEQYVRIRRSCTAGDRNCAPTSTYYCPDTCHEVSPSTQGGSTSAGAGAPARRF